MWDICVMWAPHVFGFLAMSFCIGYVSCGCGGRGGGVFCLILKVKMCMLCIGVRGAFSNSPTSLWV